MKTKLISIICAIMLLSSCTGRSGVEDAKVAGSANNSNSVDAGGQSGISGESNAQKAPPATESAIHIAKKFAENISIDADVEPLKTNEYAILGISPPTHDSAMQEKLTEIFLPNIDASIQSVGGGGLAISDPANPEGAFAFIYDTSIGGGTDFAGKVPDGRLPGEPNSFITRSSLRPQYLMKDLSFMSAKDAMNKMIEILTPFTNLEFSPENSILLAYDEETLIKASDLRGRFDASTLDFSEGMFIANLTFKYNDLPIYSAVDTYQYSSIPEDAGYFIAPPRAKAKLSKSGIVAFDVSDDFQVTEVLSEKNSIIPVEQAIDILESKLNNVSFEINDYKINLDFNSISLNYVIKPKTFNASDLNTRILTPAWVFTAIMKTTGTSGHEIYYVHVEMIDAVTGEDLGITAMQTQLNANQGNDV